MERIRTRDGDLWIIENSNLSIDTAERLCQDTIDVEASEEDSKDSSCQLTEDSCEPTQLVRLNLSIADIQKM